MKRPILLAIFVLWGGATAAPAQEPGTAGGEGPSRSETTVGRPSAYRDLLRNPIVPRDAALWLDVPEEPLSLSTEWLRDEVDPIRRQRKRLRRAMMERARQQALVMSPRAACGQSDKVNENVGLWKIHVGNDIDNWSPYPDRALDARTLRFPMKVKTGRPEPLSPVERMRKMQPPMKP